MIREIILDYFRGIFDSSSPVPIISLFISYTEARRIILKIIRLHITIYILCHILSIIGNSIICNIIYGFIGIYVMLFNTLYYIEYINILSKNKIKRTRKTPIFDSISATLTMMIYQLCMYVISYAVNYLLKESHDIIAFCINDMILALHHSIHVFNNVWKYNGISLVSRISIFEKSWIYFVAYGQIGTLLYMFSSINGVYFVYNIYIMVLLTNSFSSQIRLDRRPLYPKINTSILSGLTTILINTVSPAFKRPIIDLNSRPINIETDIGNIG